MRKYVGQKAIFIAICLILLPVQVAMAAILSNLRSGSNDERTRLVVSTDYIPKYSESVIGKQLIITFDAKVKKTEIVKPQDPLVKRAVLERFNTQSRLIVDFYRKVPKYVVFSLKQPNRIVVDFKKINPQKRSLTIAKGVTYTYTQTYLEAKPETLHVLEIAPKSGYILKPILGQDNLIHKGILTQMAMRAGAVAAVNASYFDSEVWVVGNLMLDKKWISAEDSPHTALVIDDRNEVKIIPNTTYVGQIRRPDGKIAAITGLNRSRITNDLIYYNDAYNTSTCTNVYGTEVRIEKNRVTEVSNTGNLTLRPNTIVLSGNGTAAIFLQGLKVGDRVSIRQSFGIPAANTAKYVVGAGPLLVDKGVRNVQSAAEYIASDIAKGRSPRTAIGIRSDGTILVVVVDGRSSVSAGLTLDELADYMVKLHAYKAMNFDGGGSSEMVVGGNVVNVPSDGKERPIRVALGVFAR
ncbi:MAG: phosphodiester glycosidase family protein [Acidaminococcaceae bacterium]|nr:phosphodiester glycosidase family protein [Acidaminococcaceae bacterium]